MAPFDTPQNEHFRTLAMKPNVNPSREGYQDNRANDGPLNGAGRKNQEFSMVNCEVLCTVITPKSESD